MAVEDPAPGVRYEAFVALTDVLHSEEHVNEPPDRTPLLLLEWLEREIDADVLVGASTIFSLIFNAELFDGWQHLPRYVNENA
jgi:hypothetical protein